MKTYLIAALLVLTAVGAGCAGFSGGQTIHGSGRVIAEDRQVRDFDRVSISGAGELTLTQGSEELLTIETDDNLLPLIQSEVQSGRLSIGPRNMNLGPTKGIRYRLKLKNLRDLELSGSARAEAAIIQTEGLTLSLSGSGIINVGHLETASLSTRISGSGSTSAAGHAETQTIHISGSGNHHAPELQSAQADVHISGSGHTSLWVTRSLTAHISGSGGVDYRGDCSVDSHMFGSGQVRQR